MNIAELQPMARADQVDLQTLANISDFLFHESQLLDANMFGEWFKLIHPAVRYVMPVRITRMKGEGSELSDSSHIDEGYQSLKSRIARFEHRLNWAENPASRQRHFVTNIRAVPLEDEGREGFRVHSNVLFHRSRLDETHSDYLSCMRQDKLVVADGDFQLLERIVVFDHSTLPTDNISFLI